MKFKFNTIDELNDYFEGKIAGGFFKADMAVQKEEIEKLNAGDVYLEIGVDEGKSLSCAYFAAKEGVFCVGVDYIDPPARAPYMNQPFGYSPNGQGLIVHGSSVMYIHGDAEMVAKVWDRPINLLFIDGDHSYEGVKKDHDAWFPKVVKGGTVLYHDYDHPETKQFLDDTFGDNKEVLHNKIVRVRK